jgi:hypothetical protein
MAVKKQNKVKIKLNPNWVVTEEYSLGKDYLVPGDNVRIKFFRGQYKFIRHIYNTNTKTEWFDVVGPDGFRSLRIEDVKKIKPKKFRKKSNVN